MRIRISPNARPGIHRPQQPAEAQQHAPHITHPTLPSTDYRRRGNSIQWDKVRRIPNTTTFRIVHLLQKLHSSSRTKKEKKKQKMTFRALLGAFRNRSFATRVAPCSRFVSPLLFPIPPITLHAQSNQNIWYQTPYLHFFFLGFDLAILILN